MKRFELLEFHLLNFQPSVNAINQQAVNFQLLVGRYYQLTSYIIQPGPQPYLACTSYAFVVLTVCNYKYLTC